MTSRPANQEIELKLLVAPEDIDKLAGLEALGDKAAGAPTIRRFETTYFDTPDRRLRRRKLALRLRADGKRLIQTLKAKGAGTGAISQRGEWECDVPGPGLDLSRLDDPVARDRLGLVLEEELAPVFVTRFERRAFEIDFDDSAGRHARVELAIDRGAIVAGTREEPISEVELELLEGDPVALYGLVDWLRQNIPLRLGTLDKAVRGHRLADGIVPPPVAAGAAELHPTVSTGDALNRILGTCVAQWIANEAAAVDGGDAEGVHQLRIAVRRLRAALFIFRPIIGRLVQQHWNSRLRSVIDATRRLRQLDVLLAETIPQVQEALPGNEPLEVFASRVRDARQEALEDFRSFVAGQDYADLLLDIAAWLGREEWRLTMEAKAAPLLLRPARKLASRQLERACRKVLKRGQKFADLRPDQRHEVRLALKRLRYGTDFFASLYADGAPRKFRRVTSRLQDALGSDNDIAESRALIESLLIGRDGASPEPAVFQGAGLVEGWYARSQIDLEETTLARWRDFTKAKPFWHD